MIASTLMTLLVIEIVLRVLIGQPISFRKLGDPDVTVRDSQRDPTEYASVVTLVAETDLAWINLDPRPLPQRHRTVPEMLAWRENARDVEWPDFENSLYRQWNAAYLRTISCDAHLPILSTPGPLFEFECPDGSAAPLYRYLPDRRDPLGMRTNRFARRGPDLPLDKPEDPTLFLGGVHFNCDGIRLQPWIVFQKLLPLVEGRITAGRWPRPDEHPLQSHPGIPEPRLVYNFYRDATVE